MKVGNSKLFNDKNKLYEMLNLRFDGFSNRSLAYMYGCTVSSIREQCKKWNVKPKNNLYSIFKVKNSILNNFPLNSKEKVEYMEIGGEKICKGKSYKEYLEDYRNKK